jgi:transposase
MPYLSKSERLVIELKRREVRTKKEHVRLTVLIMLDEGFSQETIALCLGIHADTVRNWKQKYESVSRNLPRYLSDHYVAFQGYLSAEQLLQFDAHLQAQLALTSRQAGDYLFERYGLDYSDAGVTALLHRLDFVYKKVKPVPGKADQQAQEAFVCQLEELLEKPDTVVYFTDASHPSHNTQPHYGWIKKGKEKQIAANTARQRLNLQGAVHVGSRIQALVQPAETINSQSVIDLYARLLKNHRQKKIVVICDNAPYHRSGLLAKWLQQHPHISQKFLPAYPPNLNLIERRWKWMKKKVTATVYYPTFEEFKKAVLDLFARLPDYHQVLKSLLTLKFKLLNSPLLITQTAG